MILQNVGRIVILISWLVIAGHSLGMPTFVRRPIAVALRQLQELNSIDSGSPETWAAVHIVAEYCHRTGIIIFVSSILMLGGFLLIALTPQDVANHRTKRGR